MVNLEKVSLHGQLGQINLKLNINCWKYLSSETVIRKCQLYYKQPGNVYERITNKYAFQ